MKKILRSCKLFALTAASVFGFHQANAQMVGADVFLQGDYVEIGVGTGGWYGSGAAGPAGFHGRTPGPTVGFVSDPDKDGWAAGIPNYCGDYFVPGYPQEGWDIQVGSSWAKAWLGTGFVGGITGTNVSYTSVGGEMRGTWEGNFAGVGIRQTTILKKSKVYFLIKITLKNTTSADIKDIYYDRTLDPDNVSTMGATGTIPGIITSSGSSTVNTIEFRRPNLKSRSLVSAIGQLTVVKPSSPDTVDYPVYLGIGSKDCRANPYILSSGLTPGTNDSPSRLYNKQSPTGGTPHLFDSGQTNFTDVATGLIFKVDVLKPGDSTSFFMAYVLSTADLDSAFADMAPVWQYDGKQYESGDTIKLCRDKAAPDEIKTLNIGGGEDYTWIWSARPGLKNSTGTENEILLTNTPVTYVARPSEGFGCVDSMVITVMPYINPDPPTVTSPVTYCRFGSAKPLEAKGLSSAVMKYFTTATGSAFVYSLTPSTNAAGTFTYYASQLNGICESARTPITVIVNPIPDLEDFTSFDPTFCGGADGWIKFKVTGANEEFTVNYDRNGVPNSGKFTSDASSYITINGLTRGSYTNIFITNKFGCISNTYFGPIELVGPFAAPPIVSNNGPICIGELAKLTTAVKDSTTYLWTGPDGFSSTDPNPSFIAKMESMGTYTLVTTKKSCVSDPAQSLLVIIPDPKKSELPDFNLCQGQSLFGNVIAEPNTDYIWTGPDGFSSNTASLKRSNVEVSHSGPYILNASNERGCKMADTVMVFVDPKPTLTHSADTGICIGDAIDLFAITNMDKVVWSPTTGLNDANSKNPRVNPTATTVYTVTTQGDNSACPDTSGQVTVTVIPSPMVKGYDTTVRMNIPYTLVPMFGQEVVKWKWTPSDSLSCSDCPNPKFNSNKAITYILTVSDKNGCSNAADYTINVFCDGENVTMPNAFTPNNDGSNDIYYVRGTGFTVKTFTIFNRLGQIVFSKENFAPNDPSYGWDGTFNGQAISDAAGFVYMLEVVCFNSKNAPLIMKGTVLMIK